MAITFEVPTKENISESNKAIFDQLEKGLGFVPNLYAAYAYNDSALGDYLALQNRKSTLKAREREVINLVVSQVNGCEYCLAAHTALGKMNGFTDDEILAIRSSEVPFDTKLNALAQYVQDSVINRGKVSESALQNFFSAGYTKAQLVDVIVVIGDKIISNFIHGATQVPVDFPLAQPLTAATV